MNYIIDEPFSNCLVCAVPVASESLCSKHHLPYSRAWCVSARKGALKNVIDDYKFNRALSAHLVLSELVHQRLPDLPVVEVVPVPTTPRNIRIRGYDHISLLAEDLAKKRSWGMAPLLSRRSNVTQHFAKTAADRRRQAKDFFEISRPVSTEKTYLVIDDIFTTGATLECAADCLRQAGATDVWAVVIVRQ